MEYERKYRANDQLACLSFQPFLREPRFEPKSNSKRCLAEMPAHFGSHSSDRYTLVLTAILFSVEKMVDLVLK